MTKTDTAPAQDTGTQLQLADAPAAGHSGIAVRTVDDARNMANLLRQADIGIPASFRGNQGACLALVFQATRWGFDPYGLAQAAYVVGDKVGFEAKVFAAVVNAHAPLARRLRYSYAGELYAPTERDTKAGGKMPVANGTRTCTVTGYLLGDDEPFEYTTPAISDIHPKNSTLWAADPDRQLAYYAVRAWARLYAPEVVLGLFTADELQDSAGMMNVTPQQQASAIEAALDGPPPAKAEPVKAAPAAASDDDTSGDDDAMTLDGTATEAEPVTGDAAPGDDEAAADGDGAGSDDAPSALDDGGSPAGDDDTSAPSEPATEKVAAPGREDLTAEAEAQVAASKVDYRLALEKAGTVAAVDAAYEALTASPGYLHFSEAEDAAAGKLRTQRKAQITKAKNELAGKAQE